MRCSFMEKWSDCQGNPLKRRPDLRNTWEGENIAIDVIPIKVVQNIERKSIKFFTWNLNNYKKGLKSVSNKETLFMC